MSKGNASVFTVSHRVQRMVAAILLGGLTQAAMVFALRADQVSGLRSGILGVVAYMVIVQGAEFIYRMGRRHRQEEVDAILTAVVGENPRRDR